MNPRRCIPEICIAPRVLLMPCAKKKALAAAPTVLPYLRPEALKFLRALNRNNDRAWFQPRKETFDSELKRPMLAIIEKINQQMIDFAPAYIRQPEKCLFRIYRDTRFSNDKRPYKTHVAAWWMPDGFEKTSGAGFYFEVNTKELIIAAGAWMPAKDQLLLIRNWMLEHHEDFRKLLRTPAIKNNFGEFESNRLIRAPKGFPNDHPADEFIRCRQWGISVSLEPELALDPKFATLIAGYFKKAAPIVAALNEPLLQAQQSRKKPLFGFR